MESTEPRLLPTEFDRDTVFVYPTTLQGDRLEFYVDSAGGDWIYTSTADAIGARHVVAATETAWGSAELPRFRSASWIPSPQSDGLILLNPDGPDPDEVGPPVGASGMLGQRWFGGRVWEIDYPRERMLVHAVCPSIDGTSVLPLAFAERDGVRMSHFGRLQVMIDGSTLDVLFDTGAHTRLSEVAGRAGAAGSVTATSFIIESIAQGLGRVTSRLAGDLGGGSRQRGGDDSSAHYRDRGGQDRAGVVHLPARREPARVHVTVDGSTGRRCYRRQRIPELSAGHRLSRCRTPHRRRPRPVGMTDTGLAFDSRAGPGRDECAAHSAAAATIASTTSSRGSVPSMIAAPDRAWRAGMARLSSSAAASSSGC